MDARHTRMHGGYGRSAEEALAKRGLIGRVADVLRVLSGRYHIPELNDPGLSTQLGKSMATYYYERMKLENDRKFRYRDYEAMDENSGDIIGSGLDVYADNATFGSLDKNEPSRYEVLTDNSRAASAFKLMENMTRIRHSLWQIARSLSKFGDHFEEIVVIPDLTVSKVVALSPRTVRIVTNERGFPITDNQGAMYVQTTKDGVNPIATFAPWQIIHWKMATEKDALYGVKGSVLARGRYVWRQLQMMEDGMVIRRLSRASMRYAYGVDTGSLGPRDALQLVQEFKEYNVKKKLMNTTTGQLSMDNNPMVDEDDIYLPSGEGAKFQVKTLQGQSNLAQIGDVEYFLNKLFASIKVPKAYLGWEADTHNRNVITQLDIQFARTVRRLQWFLTIGLRQLYDTTLHLNGIDPDSVDYEFRWPVISTEDEMRQWSLTQIRAQVVQVLKQTIPSLPDPWLLMHFLDLGVDDIRKLGYNPDEKRKEQPVQPVVPGKSGAPVPRSAPVPKPGDKEKVERLRDHPLIKGHLNDLKFLTEWRLNKRPWTRSYLMEVNG